MDMYTLLYLKWIINKDLLFGTWNSAPCYVAAWMGGVFGVECWLLSHVQVFVAPRTVAGQAPLSMEFFRQEYWNGSPSPSPGIFLTQGSNPCLLYLLPCRCILYHLSHQRSRIGQNGYTYMYGWVALLSAWNYHNIDNQLYANIK